MRLTVQRARIIDTIRAYGPMAEEVISARLGVSKRNTRRQIAGMVGEGAIDLRGGGNPPQARRVRGSRLIPSQAGA